MKEKIMDYFRYKILPPLVDWLIGILSQGILIEHCDTKYYPLCKFPRSPFIETKVNIVHCDIILLRELCKFKVVTSCRWSSNLCINFYLQCFCVLSSFIFPFNRLSQRMCSKHRQIKLIVLYCYHKTNRN